MSLCLNFVFCIISVYNFNVPKHPGPPQGKSLADTARLIRRDVVSMASKAKSAHVAPALSCVDILTALYFGVMDIDPADPAKKDRDRFILSKGHAAMALYSCLARRGYFPSERLDAYLREDDHLDEHPSPGGAPGVEFGTGSLGHGLALGAGVALALRHRGLPGRVFIVVGDGECNEGAVYEAAALAGALKLGKVVVVVDNNGLQACDTCNKISGETDLPAMFRALGWETAEADGHDLDALVKTLYAPRDDGTPPLAVFAKTVKGKGVSFMEHDLEWHYRPPNADDLARALKELE